LLHHTLPQINHSFPCNPHSSSNAFTSYLSEFTRHRPPSHITNADQLDAAASPPPHRVHIISRHPIMRSRSAVITLLLLLRLPQWFAVYTVDARATFGESPPRFIRVVLGEAISSFLLSNT
jgi:hypothetical protein